jgi:RNA polymerase-binding protein DksA
MDTRRPRRPRAARPKRRVTYLTDGQLAHFREKLLALRAETLDEIARLRQQIYEDSEQADDDPDRLYHALELDPELTASMIARNQEVLDALDLALTRIEARTYGICIATDRPIPLARLEAVPYTERSVEAEEEAEAARGVRFLDVSAPTAP